MAILSAAEHFLAGLNRHRWWRTQRTVWGSRLSVPSADRLLYVTLHQWGVMGGCDRRFYETQIRPGMTVLDIGANIGLFTQLFARLVGPAGRVYAFEPEPVLFQALQSACDANRAANVSIFQVGLGEVDEDRWLERSCFNSGDNRMSPDLSTDPAKGEPARVTLRRGDNLLPEPLTADFIKIDVQGWELHALRGLEKLIERSPRVQIFLEFWPNGLRAAGAEPSALFEFLRERGLTVLQLAQGREWAPVARASDLPVHLTGQRFVNLRALKE